MEGRNHQTNLDVDQRIPLKLPGNENVEWIQLARDELVAGFLNTVMNLLISIKQIFSLTG
jgi:hypothetical protein